MKRIGIFVDLSNLYYSTRSKYGGRKPNYRAIYEFAGSLGEITIARAYGTKIGPKAHNFACAIEKIGFIGKYKPPKRVGRIIKANCDVDLVVDAIKVIMSEGLDIMILCTADGDFAPFVEWCKEQGIIVIVLGCGISFELKDQSSHCIELPDSMVETGVHP